MTKSRRMRPRAAKDAAARPPRLAGDCSCKQRAASNTKGDGKTRLNARAATGGGSSPVIGFNGAGAARAPPKKGRACPPRRWANSAPITPRLDDLGTH
ncbi:hypothetical protein EVAR_37339_1 [Eumeta japonica]|uniref:Uncharacterized protein n=1 Tax=Eumeta variegata TaxID=151549 RepID=A0A4C1X1N1_EUMVA|nr:hypothetical protein EVAR_37339_1 [Eumeta japonica]